ncbi:hypothetical protein CCH79_00014251 [Gambusia affinis]|uniref:Chemokine interleukin-8-like domain-containing protein n=1 Tax=Gambusia affinis TaxID=33528 RepID=A0A315UXE3_GAMAF|nr:hypothetical protein CCH79_00014251 [Gambusia affinis]
MDVKLLALMTLLAVIMQVPTANVKIKSRILNLERCLRADPPLISFELTSVLPSRPPLPLQLLGARACSFSPLQHIKVSAKPISLVERCWCRTTLNTVSQRSIKELKFLHTPNCPFQVIAKLKNNREVCINPETKWLQGYLKNAINK